MPTQYALTDEDYKLAVTEYETQFSKMHASQLTQVGARVALIGAVRMAVRTGVTREQLLAAMEEEWTQAVPATTEA